MPKAEERERVITFEYSLGVRISRSQVRSSLAKVRDLLLSHEINGGDKKLEMDTICGIHGCGTAACIGGWVSIFTIGFEGVTMEKRAIIARLFHELQHTEEGSSKVRLHKLFYNHTGTKDYNSPRIAATAIQRYLDGKNPWPKGVMPDVLRYKRKR